MGFSKEFNVSNEQREITLILLRFKLQNKLCFKDVIFRTVFLLVHCTHILMMECAGTC